MGLFSPSWVTTIAGPQDLDRFLGDPREAAAAGAIELRFDLWPPGSMPAWPEVGVPVIVTWRRGLADEAIRVRTLREARDRGLWVDLDQADPLHDAFLEERAERLISSVHWARPVSDEEALRCLRAPLGRGAGASKAVLAEGGLKAVRQALRLARTAGPGATAVGAAGYSGSSSRVLGPLRGSAWSYGRLAGSRGSAPGQPVTRFVADRGPSVAVLRPCFGIVGARVHRSLSAGFHPRVLAAAGLSSAFLDLSLEHPDEALVEDVDLSFDGLAVTTPYKEWARLSAEPEDAAARGHQAWNTLRRDAGGWRGSNTDGAAVADLLGPAQQQVSPAVAILGGGGAALGVGEELLRRGWSPILLVRRPAAARALRARTRLPVSLDSVCPAVGAIVNATGAGRTEADPLPWDFADLPSQGVAMDLSYEPRRTHFLDAMEERGWMTIDGLRMFAEQARHQVRGWYGVELSTDEALAIAEAAHRELEEDRIPVDDSGGHPAGARNP